ncbi:MAG: FadR family transcriptional regulator [Spirochaetales bacterium]|nr:FadR family transcriptional regulator [Spirochaetales bacterium]
MRKIEFEQVQNKKYYLQIIDQVRKQITDGTLKSGDQLPPERELSNLFGTSRASIREALSALEILGIVESRSGQGNFIREGIAGDTIDSEVMTNLLQEHSPFEIYEARLEIEPCIASLAAERATKEEKEELKKQLEVLSGIYEAMKRGVNRSEEYMEEDRKFHLLVGKCAHNSILHMVFYAVNNMMKEDLWKTVKRRGVLELSSLKNYEKEHYQIYTAIRDGKSSAARNRMFKHIHALEVDVFEG